VHIWASKPKAINSTIVENGYIAHTNRLLEKKLQVNINDEIRRTTSASIIQAPGGRKVGSSHELAVLLSPLRVAIDSGQLDRHHPSAFVSVFTRNPI